MSLPYRNRKKLIKRWKRDNSEKLLLGKIRTEDFKKLKESWRSLGE